MDPCVELELPLLLPPLLEPLVPPVDNVEAVEFVVPVAFPKAWL